MDKLPAQRVSSSKKRPRISSQNVRSEHFAVMESPHPYGFLPEGNLFLLGTQESSGPTMLLCDQESIRPTMLLSDQAWYAVLEFCGGRDLGRLVQTCRYFYAAASEPELWRDLALRIQDKHAISVFGPSWKDTYVDRVARTTGSLHSPMAVSGIYSDMFYRLHSCRSFSIPSAWLTTDSDSVSRIPFTKMTVNRFENDFEHPNRPVVIEGAACSWKSCQRWTSEYLLQHSDNRSFRATSGAAPLPGFFTMRAYLDYCRTRNLEEAPLYLFDRTALSPGSILWSDYMDDLQRTCPYWDPKREGTTHDLFQLLGEGRRPDHTWLIMGPKRSGSVFHIDPNATHAWNAAIVGRKRWIFYPPGVSPPGVHPSKDGDTVALPLSIGEWVFQFWDEHAERLNSAPLNERPLECTALPGDVLFIPHGWWHMVVNLDELNIAITHNYVSASNLSSVLKFTDELRDQVSGCRDREDSIKPESLHEELVNVLRAEKLDLLERVLQNPGWGCNAWGRTIDENVGEEKGSVQNEAKRSSVMSRAVVDQGMQFSFSFL